MDPLYTQRSGYRQKGRKRPKHTRKLKGSKAYDKNQTGPFVDPPDKQIRIGQPWGGLGDNLQYTTLPELFTRKGYDVYLSSYNKCRSHELCELIWKLNPYIKGVSNLPPNVGEIVNKYANYSPPLGYIKNIELAHGLTNGHHKYPVIYYNPKHIKGIENYLFYDPTYVSERGKPDMRKSYESIFAKYPDMTPYMLRFKQKFEKPGLEKVHKTKVNSLETAIYEIKDIYHFCDVLYSCKVYACAFSGGSVLASAIKQGRHTPEVYSFYSTGPHFKDHYFMFDNIHYAPVIV